MTATELWAFYIIASLILALIGYAIAKKSNKGGNTPTMWGFGFGIGGLILSTILWFTWGKKNTKK